jgi:hypothetical protein
MTAEGDEKLRYRQVEAALVAVIGVRPKAVGAFRARLRHLRNIGLPQLPASGSGKHIVYSRRQALEILIALRLESIGHKPQSAAIISQSIVRQSPYGQQRGKDCYVIPSASNTDSSEYKMMYGIVDVSRFMKSSPDMFTVVNVSALIRKLNMMLDRSL